MRSLLVLLLGGVAAFAQTYDTPASLAPAARAALARQLLADGTSDQVGGWNERLRLQLQAQDPEGALASAAVLRAIPRSPLEPERSRSLPLYELYARTLKAASAGAPPAQALDGAFAAMAAGLSDPAAYRMGWALGGDAAAAERDLQSHWEALRVKPRLSRAEASDLLREACLRDALVRLLPRAAELAALEEARRYLIEEDVHIETAPGVTVCATVVRPRTLKRLPTAFEFTIYANTGNRAEALRSASEGFVGVVANTRGKRHGLGPVEPYEHDGEDAAAVIAWIARQPWSDGQVGMYGGSYDGFTQWAAAKHRPPALKSIMPSVAVAPGIDVPMEGGVFQTFQYRWIPYVTRLPLLDEAGYGDEAHWNRLDQAWFESGRPYREEDRLDSAPNPIWRRWLGHPTYDGFWQRMTCYGEDFDRLDLPVLSTTGYFDGCLLSATYYFEQHTARNPRAQHYLLVGPYNHIAAQRRSMDVYGGYAIDSVARIDIEALRYQWLDHTLRGGPRPEPLKAPLNFEVMGANVWRHADRVAAMADSRLTLYLAAAPDGDHRLVPRAATRGAALKVDLAERRTLSVGPPDLIVARGIDASNALTFTSEPLQAPMELSGCFEGRLALTANKRDADLTLQLYERMADGRCFLLSYLTARASLMENRSRRRLLVPGRPILLPYRSGRPVSRRLAEGSRLVLLVGVMKHPGAQVNYGTGKDVSDESVKEAGAPLTLRFGPQSTLTLPVTLLGSDPVGFPVVARVQPAGR